MNIVKISIVCLTLFLIGSVGLVAADEYAYTTAYFYTPYDVSFTVTLLGEAVSTSSGEPEPGPLTPSWITFNQTSPCSPTCTGVQPQTNETYAQAGITEPIIQVINQGNANDFDFYLNASVGGYSAAITVWANGSLDAGSCTLGPPTVPPEDITEKTSWVPAFVNDCSTTMVLNITLYADFASPPAGQVEGAVYYRSSR